MQRAKLAWARLEIFVISWLRRIVQQSVLATGFLLSHIQKALSLCFRGPRPGTMYRNISIFVAIHFRLNNVLSDQMVRIFDSQKPEIGTFGRSAIKHDCTLLYTLKNITFENCGKDEVLTYFWAIQCKHERALILRSYLTSDTMSSETDMELYQTLRRFSDCWEFSKILSTYETVVKLQKPNKTTFLLDTRALFSMTLSTIDEILKLIFFLDKESIWSSLRHSYRCGSLCIACISQFERRVQYVFEFIDYLASLSVNCDVNAFCLTEHSW